MSAVPPSPPSSRPVALVTGASNGIGRASASALAARGAHVVLVGRDHARLADAAAEVIAAGGTAEPLVADLGTDAGVAAVVAHVRANVEQLAVVVHAAGIAEATSSITPSAPGATATFDAHFALNVRAPMQLTGALVDLVERAQGLVVAIGSVAARRAAPGFATYAASKSAMTAWADALREELAGRGVRVSALHPGQVATAMQAAIYEARGDAYHPDRLLQPEAIAALVAFAYDHPELEITDLTVRSPSAGYRPNTGAAS